MLYPYFQAYEDLIDSMRAMAGPLQARPAGADPGARPGDAPALVAGSEIVGLMGLTHARRDFDLQPVRAAGRDRAVRQETVLQAPFASLLRFSLEEAPNRPRVLLISPLSGHFATLLQGTLRTLLADHDVYLTDWHNARDIALASGRFGLDEYVAYLMRFLDVIGPGAHVVAVCQSAVPALAAAALMAEDAHAAQPRTLTLMAGPIDARIRPTKANQIALAHSLEWFAQTMTDVVPARFEGAGRRVHPGFLQLGASMAMAAPHHLEAFMGLFNDRLRGEHARAAATVRHYQEYFTMMDLPAEFYLDTVDKVFQRHALARGELEVAGRRVDPGAIGRTIVLAIEGERDEVCPPGQTVAAHALCAKLRPAARKRHVQRGAGHYDVFNGTLWETGIYPVVRDVIRRAKG